MDLFELVKNNNIPVIKKYIEKYPTCDYNIQNESGELLINYCINLNHHKILEMLIGQNIQLDNLDSDSHSILYVPIKNKYNEILEILLNSDNKTGLSICLIQDNNNLTALHYAISLNNRYAIDLIYTKTNLMMTDNDNNNFLQYAALNNNDYFVKLLLDNKNISKYVVDFINHQNNNKELVLHIICSKKNKILIDYFIEILNKNNQINLNLQDEIKQYSFFHYLCELNDKKNILQIIDKVNINLCDSDGNTCMHILANNKYYDLIDIIINHFKDKNIINFNKYNINLEYPLHLLLKDDNMNQLKNLGYIIEKTNLNFADKEGNTCLFYLCKYNLWNHFREILEHKKLNIFVKNKLNQTINDVVTDSANFLEMIIKNHDNLLNIKNMSSKDFKKYKIEKLIEKYSTNAINQLSTFSGLSFDMLCGLKFLEQNNNITSCYNLKYLDMSLCNDIKSFECSLESNFIRWEISSEKSNIYINEKLIEEFLKNTKTKYLIIFVVLQNEDNKHANIIIVNTQTKEAERYDPYGLSLSIPFNYVELDKKLISFFKKYDLKYINSSEYLEYINLQKINNNIDTDNYCVVWCIWLVYIYVDTEINRKKLIKYIIEIVNTRLYKYKNIINNFNNEIVEIRNNIFSKLKIDFNDYYNGNINKEVLNQLIIELNKYTIKKI